MKNKIDNSYMLRRSAGMAFFFVSCASSVPHARAALSVGAVLTDLADTVPGQDRWSVSYQLSGSSFLFNQGFTILFDPLLYANLSAPLAPIPTGWDVLSIQPDVGLSAPGYLDGLAQINNPLLTQPFGVEFRWLGSGNPGAQAFQTYSQVGQFQITGVGQTQARIGSQPIVPEPGTITLGLALTGFILSARRRRGVGTDFPTHSKVS